MEDAKSQEMLKHVDQFSYHERKMILKQLDSLEHPEKYPEVDDAKEFTFVRCIYCKSEQIKRAGRHDGKQKYNCKECNKTFHYYTWLRL